MGAPTVLLYNLDTEKGRRIKLLCMALKLRVRSVSPEKYGLTVDQVLHGEGAETSGGEPFPEEMLVMADMTSGQVDQLLQGFRRKKIQPVALKAIVTPANLQWDARKLRDELTAEHEAMKKGETAHPGEPFKNER